MEYCQKCACSCKPINLECVADYTDIQEVNVIRTNHYNKASLDMEELIGVDCADELCNALSLAYEQLGESTDENATIEDFLPEIWLNIINNRYFKMWYANRLLWHYVNGASISEIRASGLVTTSNNDSEYKNDYQHAGEKERKRIETSAKFYSDQARTKFNDLFWCYEKTKYPCAELDCGCNKHHKCELHCDPCHKKRKGIGIDII